MDGVARNPGIAEDVPGGVLVVGIGNDLCGDDGAGRRIAERLEDASGPGTCVCSVHQLLPELVEELAGRALVVFVDADRGVTAARTQPVQPAAPGRSFTHHLGPASLLELARTIGIEPPPAVLVRVPAVEFGHGSALSHRAAAGVEQAVALVVELIQGVTPPE